MSTKKQTAKTSGSRVMTDTEIEQQLKRMGAEIAAQPRTEVRLPMNPLDDPKDQVQYVAINGYSFYIPRGVTVSLPECVIEVLEQVGVL